MTTSRSRKITSFIALAMLGLALIAMVITGFGTDGMGGLGGLQGTGGTTTLVRVEGRAIGETEVSDMVTQQYQAARNAQPDLTMAGFMAGGTFDQILQQMVTSAAIAAFAEKQGLAVSREMVDRAILEIPQFRNFAGQFDENAFRGALRAINMTEGQLRDDIRRQLLQQQLLAPMALSMRVPEGLAREYSSLLLERRRGSIGVVPAEAFAAGIEPSDQEIAAFYRANQARFVVPERRVVRYALLGREQVAGDITATDQEIAAHYRDNQARYGGQEQRSLQQVVLPDQAAAQAFMQRLRGGQSFADSAAAAGFAPSDVDLGVQTPEEFARETTPEVSRAAFAAAEGAVVGPIRSELGFHIVRVQDISRTAARTLAEAREEIVREIEQRKFADALGGLIARVEEQIADGASFEEIARAENLQAQQAPPVTAAGQVEGEGQLAPELQSVLRSVFEIDPEDPEPVVEQLQANERFMLISVERVIPAAAPPLAQIRAEVREAAIRAQAMQRARAAASQIVEKVNGGMPIARAMSEAGVRLPPAQSLDLRRMDISQAGERVPPPIALMFSLPENAARILEAPAEAGWFVVVHEERTPGNAADQPQLIETTRTQFTGIAGEELAQQFARAVEMQTDIRRDEAAIGAVRQRLSGGAD